MNPIYHLLYNNSHSLVLFTIQLIKLSDTDFSIAQGVWSHLLKKYIMENFIFCEGKVRQTVW